MCETTCVKIYMFGIYVCATLRVRIYVCALCMLKSMCVELNMVESMGVQLCVLESPLKSELFSRLLELSP